MSDETDRAEAGLVLNLLQGLSSDVHLVRQEQSEMRREQRDMRREQAELRTIVNAWNSQNVSTIPADGKLPTGTGRSRRSVVAGVGIGSGAVIAAMILEGLPVLLDWLKRH